MKVKICIGSSCHIKGSREIVEKFQQLIKQNGLQDKVELLGEFCMGQCRSGVNVKVDDVIYSVTPKQAEDFFKKEITEKLK